MAILRGRLLPAGGPPRALWRPPLASPPAPPAPPRVQAASGPAAQGSQGREGRACRSRGKCGTELFPGPSINYSWLTNYRELSNAFDLGRGRHEAHGYGQEQLNPTTAVFPLQSTPLGVHFFLTCT